jgi:hypothetical protein
MAMKIPVVVFWFVMWQDTSVSEDLATFIFRVKHCFTYPEDGDITTQKTTT